jgi:hypothetical protein
MHIPAGQVVGVEKEQPMRGHVDIENESAKYVRNATKFYQSLAGRCVQNGHVIDVFACALDQCGVYEMKLCVERTGGSLVQTDTFTNVIFKESFKRIFARDEDNNLSMAFNGEMEVITSHQFKVAGAIGCCQSLNKKSPCVAEMELGQGVSALSMYACAFMYVGKDLRVRAFVYVVQVWKYFVCVYVCVHVCGQGVSALSILSCVCVCGQGISALSICVCVCLCMYVCVCSLRVYVYARRHTCMVYESLYLLTNYSP